MSTHRVCVSVCVSVHNTRPGAPLSASCGIIKCLYLAGLYVCFKLLLFQQNWFRCYLMSSVFILTCLASVTALLKIWKHSHQVNSHITFYFPCFLHLLKQPWEKTKPLYLDQGAWCLVNCFPIWVEVAEVGSHFYKHEKWPSSFFLFPVRWAETAPPLLTPPHPSALLCLSVHLRALWAAPAHRRDTVLRDCPAPGEPMASGPPCPSVGRRLRLLELLLVPLLVLLGSGSQPALGQKVYTNTWAVHIPGGPAEAEQVASKHGFINYGHVSKSINIWTNYP